MTIHKAGIKVNFSRVDHVQLTLSYNAGMLPSEILLFVEGYNILSVKDGMAGLKFSN
jgi:hypothetical protein